MRLATATSLALVALIAGAPAVAADEIDWHKGDVQAALDRARSEGKPLFLYWGAVWCPPCNQIQKTVFTRREFIDKTRLFIPVYLDGDTENAQVWGEKLRTSGYPTMIVLSPRGEEVLRLPTGLQAEQFVAVLDEALARMTPVSEVLRTALGAADPKAVPDQSWRLLAYHSWGQDELLKLSPEEREAKLRAVETRAPARLKKERSRLFAHWLSSRIELAAAAKKDKEKEEAAEIPAKERARAEARVIQILTDPELTLVNLEFLEGASADVVAALQPRPGTARTRLIARWEETMDRVERDEKLSVDERLSSLLPRLELARLEKGAKAEIDAKLRDRVRTHVAWADENAKDAYTRQAAMSTAGYLLKQSGLMDEAKALYLAQLEKAPSPHYFMSSLAEIAKEERKKEEAIGWMAKAYEKANGRATRFQWGTSYVLGLIDLAPEDGARIQSESLRVLRELLGFDDAFAGRNHARIKRLDKKFREWNAKSAHAAEVEAVRAALMPSCAGLSDQPVEGGSESLRSRCSGFSAGLGGEEPAPGPVAAKR